MSDALSPLLDAFADLLASRVAVRLSERPDEDQLLTVAQAAKRSGLSGQSIRRLVKANTLPRVKGLKEIRIRASSLATLGK
jgi:predicted DNA-binding transcriptional regulator AlpA